MVGGQFCAHHHPMLGFSFNHHVLQSSKYNFGICPFSLSMDNGSNLGVTMPSDRLNPLVVGELVRQMPCNREKVNCEDGFQGILIGPLTLPSMMRANSMETVWKPGRSLCHCKSSPQRPCCMVWGSQTNARGAAQE